MIFQLGGPLLDACVLAVLSREDTYGYKITSDIKEIIEISDSTMYPVLRRLQKDGLVTVYDQPFEGRNRRYYHITEMGLELSRVYGEQWREYKSKVNQILDGGN